MNFWIRPLSESSPDEEEGCMGNRSSDWQTAAAAGNTSLRR